MFPGLPAAAFETPGGAPVAQRLADSCRRVQAARDADDFAALHTARRIEGELLLLSGEPHAALGAFLEAVALCEVSDLSGQARLWQLAARAQAALAAPAEAQEYLGLGLRLMEEARDLTGAIDLLEDLAALHARAGEHQRELEHLEANLTLRRELGDAAGLCRTLLAVGKSRLRQQPAQVQRAQRDLKAAIKAAQEIGSVSLLAQARGWLGHAHWLLQHLDEADSLFSQSYHDLERLGDLARMAQVRLGQGRVAASRADPPSALRLGGQALDLCRQSGNRSTEVQVLLLLSEQSQAGGDLAAALEYHRAYHELSVQLHRARSEHRAQQIAARIGLQGSRQEADFYRERGSLLERRVAERAAQLEATQMEMIELLASAAECRDAPQGLHNAWVGEASACVALHLGWNESQARDLGLAARLHDIGKLAVPDAVLLKQGPLIESEWTLMRTHTTLGARLLSCSTSPLLALAAEIAQSHHERWDGLGYPAGLRGSAIPQSGRIVAVVDTFDALISQRPYKAAWTLEEAAAYLHDKAGQHFDPLVVAAVVELHRLGELPPRDERALRAVPSVS
ncbi:HD domain-containing phosphohydrolase [Deinococcus irradiatisoli]|nr:HD domain-containing phosphohydrolase [Deinococcus irradiatisoli]